MRFCISILSCVFWLASTAFSLDREAFTFTKYQLDVRIEPEQQRLGVRGQITIRNDSAASQKVAVLQISSSLDWRSIRAGDEPLQFVSQPYTSDIDHTGELSEAVITLPRELKPKESIELEIGYEGVISLNATRLTRIGTPEAAAKNSDWDQISSTFSGVRGIGQVAWYPVALEATSFSQGNSVFAAVARWKARESDAEMNATLHIEEATSSTTVMCNGTSPTNREGTCGDAAVECDYAPLGISVPAFAVGKYETVSNNAGDFLFLSDHSEAAEGYASSALLVSPLIEEWTGSPKSKIRVLEIPDPGAAPFEAGNLMLMPFAIVDRGLARLTLAHGITHTAFFSQRPWINEGVAHFMQALEREQLAGRKAALDYMGLHRAAFVDAEMVADPSKSERLPQPLISTLDEAFYRSKAMYVWWMLRDMIGDSALKQVLHRYDPKQDADAKYIERLVSAESKRDLAWFFDDWVYQDKGLPDFRVSAAFSRKTDKGTYLLTITVENTGTAGAEVPIAVNFEGGEIGQRLEVRAKSKSATRIEVSGSPHQVVVNDGSVPESDLTNNTYTITPQ